MQEGVLSASIIRHAVQDRHLGPWIYAPHVLGAFVLECHCVRGAIEPLVVLHIHI